MGVSIINQAIPKSASLLDSLKGTISTHILCFINSTKVYIFLLDYMLFLKYYRITSFPLGNNLNIKTFNPSLYFIHFGMQ